MISPMRFFALRFSAALLVAEILPAGARAAQVEPPKPKSAVPIFAEILYAPTDFAALRKRVGRRVVLEGKIAATGSSRTGTTSYLNFTQNYHDSVSLVFLGTKGIAKEQFAAFIGKKIHVGGILEDRNGALQMRVFDLEQIKVLP